MHATISYRVRRPCGYDRTADVREAAQQTTDAGTKGPAGIAGAPVRSATGRRRDETLNEPYLASDLPCGLCMSSGT